MRERTHAVPRRPFANLSLFTMHDLFHQLVGDPWGRLLIQYAATEGLVRAGMSLLVIARLIGCLGVGVLLGRTLLTWPVRVGLIVLLTLVVVPTLPLAGETVPSVQWVGHAIEAQRGVLQRQGLPHGDSVQANSVLRSSAHAGDSIGSALASPVDFVAALMCELVLGAVLGLGMAVVLSGLKLAGEWFDRHTGLGMGSVMNPERLSEGSVSAEMLLLFGIAALLLMEPVGGHLLFARTILETFHTLPVAEASHWPSLFDLLSCLMRQSLLLGLRVALPLVMAMSLIDLTLGFVSRSSRWSLLPALHATRTAAALLMLSATLPGVAESVTTTVLESVRLSRECLLSGEVAP